MPLARERGAKTSSLSDAKADSVVDVVFGGNDGDVDGSGGGNGVSVT